jgi:hypothetical protein
MLTSRHWPAAYFCLGLLDVFIKSCSCIGGGYFDQLRRTN